MWFFIAALLIWQGTLRIKKTLNSIFSSDNEWQLMVKSRLNQLLPFASTILAATSIYYGLKLILLGPEWNNSSVWIIYGNCIGFCGTLVVQSNIFWR